MGKAGKSDYFVDKLLRTAEHIKMSALPIHHNVLLVFFFLRVDLPFAYSFLCPMSLLTSAVTKRKPLVFITINKLPVKQTFLSEHF